MKPRSINLKPTNLKPIAQWIAWGCAQCHKVSDSPRLDAEILLTHVLKKPRAFCRTWPDKVLSLGASQRYQDVISLRLKPSPIAYIVGYKEFWSRDFKVNTATLIPRPDTELLIEKALNFLNRDAAHKSILDLGTGSACIAITLDLEHPNSSVVAADIAKDALTIAQINAQLHASNLIFKESSWFSHIDQLFDLIVANPPYIAKHDKHLIQGDLPAEPLSALVSGNDGLADIRLLIAQSPQFLKLGGMLMIEHGFDQKLAVYKLFCKHGFKDIQQYNDLGQQARLSSGIKQ